MLEKLLNKARALIEMPVGRAKHFSFLLRKGRVVSVGWNQADKTHPIAKRYGSHYASIHSELHCLLNYHGPLEHCVMINVRLSKIGLPRMSKPCKTCQLMLRAYRLSKVLFTNTQGVLEEL